jgi:hypothetical protein
MARTDVLGIVSRVVDRVLLRDGKKFHGRLYVARRAAQQRLRRFADLGPAPDAPARVASATLVAGLPPGRARDVFPGERVRLEPPRDASERFARIPGWYPSDRWRLDHELPPERTLELPGGVVFGHEGWLGPDEHRVFSDWNTLSRADHDIARACHRALAGGVVELPGTTASLLQLGWGNYFHWMLQGLPRLFPILDTFGDARIDRFLVGRDRPFIAESLERLGIGPDRCQRVPATTTLRCESLITASTPTVYAPVPRWAIDRVRAMFPPGPQREGSQRIYIERGLTRRRRVVNEPEVQALLSEHGFRSVSMDGMTVADQAALVASAAVIVGAHGAALTNVVFSHPGTRVIELLPANDPKPIYWQLGQRVGADYDVLVGAEPALRRAHDVWMTDSDIVVDVRALERLVGR